MVQEPSLTQRCTPGKDYYVLATKPLLVPIFPFKRAGQQIGTRTDSSFYEQCMSLQPRDPPAVSKAACKTTEPESVSWGLGSPSLPSSCCTVSWWGQRSKKTAAMRSNKAVSTCLSQKSKWKKQSSQSREQAGAEQNWNLQPR